MPQDDCDASLEPNGDLIRVPAAHVAQRSWMDVSGGQYRVTCSHRASLNNQLRAWSLHSAVVSCCLVLQHPAVDCLCQPARRLWRMTGTESCPEVASLCNADERRDP